MIHIDSDEAKRQLAQITSSASEGQSALHYCNDNINTGKTNPGISQVTSDIPGLVLPQMGNLL